MATVQISLLVILHGPQGTFLHKRVSSVGLKVGAVGLTKCAYVFNKLYKIPETLNPHTLSTIGRALVTTLRARGRRTLEQAAIPFKGLGFRTLNPPKP